MQFYVTQDRLENRLENKALLPQKKKNRIKCCLRHLDFTADTKGAVHIVRTHQNPNFRTPHPPLYAWRTQWLEPTLPLCTHTQ